MLKVNEAIRAEERGADQIELCSHLEKEGLTPDITLTEKIFRQLSIPVKIMIRSRGGGFSYTKSEVFYMADQIRSFSQFPAAGFVIGALDNNNMPDENALRHWEEAAAGTPLCFHKAIDLTPDWKRAMDMISEVRGISAILTSGQHATAREGIGTLEEMVKLYGDRFEIISAGSITYLDIPFFLKNWSGRSFHGRRLMESQAS